MPGDDFISDSLRYMLRNSAQVTSFHLFVSHVIETPSVDISGVVYKGKTFVGFIFKIFELSKHSSELYNAVKSSSTLRTFTRYSSEGDQGIVSFP